MADNPAVAAHLNTSLVELVVADGRVIGGVVEHEGERRSIRRAARSAAGRGRIRTERGHASRIRRSRSGFRHDGRAGQHGAGAPCGIAAGASTDLMDQAWWSPGLIHPDGRAAFALWFTGGIFVDRPVVVRQRVCRRTTAWVAPSFEPCAKRK